jgi:hypothetical protein
MSQALASPKGCCTNTCADPQIINIPGTPGAAGKTPNDGIDGVSAFTVLTAAFIMPAELGTVTVSVANSLWAVVLEPVFILGSTFQVTALPNSVSMTLKNLKDTANNAYMGNAAPGANFASGSGVTPTGIQGPPSAGGTNGGALSGNGPPQTTLAGGIPPNVLGSWTYWDKTNKTPYNWNNDTVAWE